MRDNAIQVIKRNYEPSMKGERAISTDTAIRFAQYFGNPKKFWLDLQLDYDLEEEATVD